jgi:protein involved in temperature-dependent protein secretion
MLTGAETTWHELPGGNWIGSGRRVWMADGEPLSLFEAGSIVLDAAA